VKRALVVEDEIMVAMYVEDLLTDLGYEVAAIATGFEQALPLARDGSFDFAVLDINLAGRLSFPIADVLRERGIPFVFASGVWVQGGRRGLPPRHPHSEAVCQPRLGPGACEAYALAPRGRWLACFRTAPNVHRSALLGLTR
jgi:hypothetical protein